MDCMDTRVAIVTGGARGIGAAITRRGRGMSRGSRASSAFKAPALRVSLL
jgi:NAD(P)-dependent dehydrogenase (short-subunit alcohol dehydrogenase family)